MAKIINVIQCANLGGMEKASLRLMIALQNRGHTFELISLNPIADLGPLLKEAGIPAHGLDYSQTNQVSTMLKLRRILSTIKADALILTGHNLIASIGIWGVGPKSRIMAMHYHHEGVMPSWRWRLIYRVANRQFQKITYPSDYVRKEAEMLFPAISPRALTVRNPLSKEAAASPIDIADFKRQHSIPENAPLIGNAGWLISRKRFDVFLRTAALIHAALPDVQFVIAGDGEERNNLEKLAANLGIAECTHFTGRLSNLCPFYSAIDVLLFNSDWDAYPTTPIEAMSYGVPVVASLLHGGLGEILDEQSGWILCNHDERVLAEYVLEALGPTGEVRGKIGRDKVLLDSAPDQIASIIEKQLMEVPNANPI